MIIGATFTFVDSSGTWLHEEEGVDLLAGRAILRSMHPFMAAELGNRFDLDLALHQGLLPLVWDSEQPEETLRAYVSLYIREEVKHSRSIRSRDLRALKSFREDYPEAEMRMLYRGDERLEIDGILCLPCSDFLINTVPGSALP